MASNIAYYGDRISENISRAPDGTLICLNVPIGRLGSMTYLGRELGVTDNPMGQYEVRRTEADLFNPATIASFEGMTVTHDHPPEFINTSNWGAYAKGHIENVRRGEGEDSDKLLADLFIKDAVLADLIENGSIRQVSSGYNCKYSPNDRGGFDQNGIRGNHLAVVRAGRAGRSVAIKDSVPAELVRKTERRSKFMKPNMANGIAEILSMHGRSAQNAKSQDDLDQLTADSATAIAAVLGGSGVQATPAVAATPAAQTSAMDAAAITELFQTSLQEALKPVNDSIAEFGTRMKALETQVADATPGEIKSDDLIQNMLNTLTGDSSPVTAAAPAVAALNEAPPAVAADALVIPPETSATSTTGDNLSIVRDAAAVILRKARPALAGISNGNERKAVVDALLEAITDATANPMGTIMQATKSAAAAAADSSTLQNQAVNPVTNMTEAQLDEYQSKYDNFYKEA